MAFMIFWKVLNAILLSRGQEEMKYGEARAWFEEYLSLR